MPSYVHFEDPPGNRLETRQFSPGQSLHIAIEITAGTLEGWAFQPTVLEVVGDPYNLFTPYYFSGSTNALGHVAWDLVLPYIVCKANVRVSINYLADISADPVITVIPIGIGVAPNPLPTPLDWKKVLLWTGVAAGVGLLGYGLLKAVQSRKPQQLILVSPPKGT
jgi:hypothetical protein